MTDRKENKELQDQWVRQVLRESQDFRDSPVNRVKVEARGPRVNQGR